MLFAEELFDSVEAARAAEIDGQDQREVLRKKKKGQGIPSFLALLLS